MSIVKKDELAPSTRSHEEIEHGAKTKQHPKKAPTSAKSFVTSNVPPLPRPKSQPRRPNTGQPLLSTRRKIVSLNKYV
ncbi:hypothetical protein BDN72DRAFT_849863 [Pluteus cervinus]|uniref:Uncharacterized protein n=1 Tax=Pluteus cervinus TaxID=181527 RepID=A0ACD3A602_9AGAR|nr:hypothetical protein BDN72DRAFT_849863 [Pluteus cervinus]